MRERPLFISRVGDPELCREFCPVIPSSEHVVPQRTIAEVQILMLIVGGVMHLMDTGRVNDPSTEPPVAPWQLAMREEIKNAADKEIDQ